MPAGPVPTIEMHPTLLLSCAVVGIFGAVALIGSVIVAPWFVPNHDVIADTISDLGAGENEWIVDFGLYSYAAGLLCLAVGAGHAHLGRWGWTMGIAGVLGLALMVTLVGARNEYGDGDNEGPVVHIYFVYALGVLYFAAPLAMSIGARRYSETWRWVFIVLAIVWGVSAPIFLLMPTGYDGIVERLIGVIALGWSTALAILLWHLGRRLPRRGEMSAPGHGD